VRCRVPDRNKFGTALVLLPLLLSKKHYRLFSSARTLDATTMAPIASTMPIAVSNRLRILGVDPAVAGATGYGVIEFSLRGARMLHSGALRLPAQTAFAARLREIHHLIARLLEEFSPDAVAVESVFTALNARTALKLAEVRGVVLLAAAQASIPAHSYSPREVKASVAGFGAASKQQIQQMVRATLGLRQPPEPADAADALAVALCHAYLSRARARIAAATSFTPAAVQASRNRSRVTRIHLER
jgi:crossover junction endodeoxyribonuclease RuvC